ncbi:hypothetical protein MINT15_02630 [Saccharomonospora viridis]|uniref:Uncharacterized protein n=1 Tax=Saccharomonospora viridis TaxID=1852 RepID=A0A837DF91_9PSEU|nr:hypothetical protein MINT15_02630 [Saccharomonospora viridis]
MIVNNPRFPLEVLPATKPSEVEPWISRHWTSPDSMALSRHATSASSPRCHRPVRPRTGARIVAPGAHGGVASIWLGPRMNPSPSAWRWPASSATRRISPRPPATSSTPNRGWWPICARRTASSTGSTPSGTCAKPSAEREPPTPSPPPGTGRSAAGTQLRPNPPPHALRRGPDGEAS